jgi:uncharacterized membrane protein
MRRLRASFLLRCVILGAIVSFGVGIVLLAQSTGWTLGTVIVVAAFWYLELEWDLFSSLIERWLTRRARRADAPVASIWFVDLDAQSDRELARFHDDTSDNPTLR